jgi:hypothetical protein
MIFYQLIKGMIGYLDVAKIPANIGQIFWKKLMQNFMVAILILFVENLIL